MILLSALSLIAALGPAPRRTLAAVDSAALFMRPGVSRELAAHRAAQIRGVAYTLSLSVSAGDTAHGSATIHFALQRPSDVIVDFRGPGLRHIMVNGAPGTTVEFNGLHLRVPAALLHAGANDISADFETLIAPAGASIIRFHDQTDNSDYLYTLLVPSDANALFPCFDQPDLKARLTLTLGVPRGWNALANGITERADTSGNGVTYDFRQTDPLPTYLFAF